MDKLKLKQMKKAYSRQKSNAKQRKIAWHYTFEEWMYKWEESGKWEQRGRSKHQYVMCRYRDEGAYSYYNTKIDTADNNNKEANYYKWLGHEPKEHVRVKEGKGRPIGTGKSVTINGKTYPTVTSAAEDLNLKRTTLVYRLSTGYYG
jgi:hypothetical protein